MSRADLHTYSNSPPDNFMLPNDILPLSLLENRLASTCTGNEHWMTFHAAATALIENRGSGVLYIENSTMKERGEFTSSRRSLCRIAICSGVRIGRSCVRRNRHESLVNPNFCRKNTSFFLELSKNIDIFFPLLSQFSFIPDKMFLIYHCVLFTLNI